MKQTIFFKKQPRQLLLIDLQISTNGILSNKKKQFGICCKTVKGEKNIFKIILNFFEMPKPRQGSNNIFKKQPIWLLLYDLQELTSKKEL